MFACTNSAHFSDEEDGSNKSSIRKQLHQQPKSQSFNCITDQSNERRLMPDEDTISSEMVDKILAEGIRLKQKCKMLRMVISDLEEQRRKDIEGYDVAIKSKDMELESRLSQMRAQLFMEMSHEKDVLKCRLEETTGELLQSSSQNAELLKRLDELSMQLTAASLSCEKKIGEVMREHENEKMLWMKRRHDEADEQRTALLRRAMLAEAELSKLHEAAKHSYFAPQLSNVNHTSSTSNTNIKSYDNTIANYSSGSSE
jgi:hypothetical protein